MLVLLVGPLASGKDLVASVLEHEYGFTPIDIVEDPRGGSAGDRCMLIERALEHVSENWQERFVVCSVWTLAHLQLFQKKPFCLVASVDAPTMVRFERWREHQQQDNSLEKFIGADDILNHRGAEVRACMMRADVHIAYSGDVKTLRGGYCCLGYPQSL